MSVDTVSDIKQYLTFNLGTEVFAIDVAQVREILEYTTITKVPKSHDFMRGVINVRGSVVPVVDMRLRFGMSTTKPTINTCIIVLEVLIDGDSTVIGALTDSVQEVSEFTPEDIEPSPKLGTFLHVEFIKGIGKHGEDFVMILDIDRIFSATELVSIVESVKTPEGEPIGEIK